MVLLYRGRDRGRVDVGHIRSGVSPSSHLVPRVSGEPHHSRLWQWEIRGREIVLLLLFEHLMINKNNMLHGYNFLNFSSWICKFLSLGYHITVFKSWISYYCQPCRLFSFDDFESKIISKNSCNRYFSIILILELAKSYLKSWLSF